MARCQRLTQSKDTRFALRGPYFNRVIREANYPAELWPQIQLAVSKYHSQSTKWWVWEDLNFRPHPYQGCALTN